MITRSILKRYIDSAIRREIKRYRMLDASTQEQDGLIKSITLLCDYLRNKAEIDPRLIQPALKSATILHVAIRKDKPDLINNAYKKFYNSILDLEDEFESFDRGPIIRGLDKIDRLMRVYPNVSRIG